MIFLPRFFKNFFRFQVVLGVFLISATVASAATYTIDDPTGDDVDNGLCSIVEAFLNYEHGGVTGSVDCTAGDLAQLTNTFEITTNIVLDTVADTVGATNYGVEVLSSSDVIINGNGHTISRDSGATEFKIFRMQGLYDFTINDLTISGADMNSLNNSEGAALFVSSAESLTLNNVTFDNNHADIGGAVSIRNESSPNTVVTITDSEFTDNTANDEGGALYLLGTNTMTVTMDGVTFDANEVNIDASYGAAVRAKLVDSITVDDSTFSNNQFDNTINPAGHANGGVFALTDSYITVTDSLFQGNGFSSTILKGGVFFSEVSTDSASINVSRSTFETNSAATGGAFYLLDGVELTLTNSTFFDNDGLDDGGVIFSQQTAVPNEINASYVTTYDSYSGQTAGSFFYNCIDNGGSCGGASFGATQYLFENSIVDGCDGDLGDAVFTNIYEYIDSNTCGTSGEVTNYSIVLEGSGGPVQTLPLLAGSNAINAGVAGTLGCPTTDARGRIRPYGAGCDIGSFEFGPDTITVTEVGGSTSVTEDGGTDTVTFFLESYPTSTVAIAFDSDGELSFSPSSITFDQADWPETITVTVSAVDDDNDEDDVYTSTFDMEVTSLDASYNAYVLSSISASVTDNDNSASSGSAPSNPTVQPEPDPTPTPVPEPEVIPLEPEPLPVEPEEVVPEPVPEEPELPIEEIDEEVDLEPVQENNNTDQGGDENSFESVKNTIKKEIDLIVLGLQDENVVDTANTVSVVGVAIPTIAFIATQPAIVANLVSIPIRLWNLIPIWLGLRRRKRPWGTVYDSVTKQPLDPVYVTLRNQSGHEVATTITDLDGRFGFLVPPGKYKIFARKDNYDFPSKKLAGKNEDHLYENLYNGEDIEILGEESLMVKNVPMDNESFNWNEFEKSKNGKLMKFYSKREILLANIAGVAFWGGLVSSVALLLVGPTTLNYILLGVYGFVFVLRIFGIKPKKLGYVLDSKTGIPLSYGLVKIFSKELNREVAHTVIGKTGKYYVLVPNGDYYVTIDKKVGEDSYKQIYKSEPFHVKKGFVGQNFNL